MSHFINKQTQWQVRLMLPLALQPLKAFVCLSERVFLLFTLLGMDFKNIYLFDCERINAYP